MDFGEVLGKAWQITWKFKVLWVFGIFSGCGVRGGPTFNFGSSARTRAPFDWTAPLPPGFEDELLRFVRFFVNPAAIAAFLSLMCVILLLAIFFSIVGRVGLIKGAMAADAGTGHLSFGELWKSGLQYFWRFFGLSLLIGSPVLLIYLALAAAAVVFAVYLSGPQGNSGSAAAPGFFVLTAVLFTFACVIFVLAVLISFLGPQAERAIVIENEGVISGLRRGWNVLTNNLGSILVVWLITVAVGLVAGILISLPVFIVAIPALLAFFVGGSHASYALLVAAAVCLLAYIPASLLADGILMAYVQSVWTLAYIRLIKPGPEAGTPVVLPANA